ncbi:MAG: hypothetical protein QOH97_2733 [Actinoplanes sp.]|jgi:hypothetical protein|nr:hypothetical protein [Actinoplanes sp.]
MTPKTTGTDTRSDEVVNKFRIAAWRLSVDVWLRVVVVRVEHHWWNGDVRLQRRDVYVRTDGELWEVEAQMGGPSGKSKVQSCPGKASALILADAWRGPRWQWRKL